MYLCPLVVDGFPSCLAVLPPWGRLHCHQHPLKPRWQLLLQLLAVTEPQDPVPAALKQTPARLAPAAVLPAAVWPAAVPQAAVRAKPCRIHTRQGGGGSRHPGIQGCSRQPACGSTHHHEQPRQYSAKAHFLLLKHAAFLVLKRILNSKCFMWPIIIFVTIIHALCLGVMGQVCSRHWAAGKSSTLAKLVAAGWDHATCMACSAGPSCGQCHLHGEVGAAHRVGQDLITPERSLCSTWEQCPADRSTTNNGCGDAASAALPLPAARTAHLCLLGWRCLR